MTTETLHGILNPDGSLELEHPPTLPPGEVEVVIHSTSAVPATNVTTDESWWHYLQRVRSEAEAAGGPFRSAEDMERERAAFRVEEDDNLYESSDEERAG